MVLAKKAGIKLATSVCVSLTTTTAVKQFCQLAGPCVDNGDCTHFAACIDQSDALAPNHTCVCTMGKSMVGGRCIGENFLYYLKRLDQGWWWWWWQKWQSFRLSNQRT